MLRIGFEMVTQKVEELISQKLDTVAGKLLENHDWTHETEPVSSRK